MKKYQEQQTELKASKNVLRGIQGNEIGSERTYDEFEYPPQPTGSPCAVGSAEALYNAYSAFCISGRHKIACKTTQ